MNRSLAAMLAVGIALVGAGLLIMLLKPDPSGDDKIVERGWATGSPEGPVRFCSGDDVSGAQRRAERDYNRRFPGSVAAFDEASFIADSQHDLYLKLIEDGEDDCDVIYLDVVYMTEFASKGLLYDMSPYLSKARQADFDDQMIETVRYGDKLWGVPKQRDVGTMYYRADRATAPTSWQDVFRQARRRAPGERPGLRLPVGSYEGLTVVFLELAYAAGADPIVSEDGKTARVNQPQVLEALRFLRSAITEGVTPHVDQQTETGNLGVYELGRASFLRGWPFVRQRLRDDAGTGRTPRAKLARSRASDHTRIVPLPPWAEGGTSVAILGGHNLVIPKSARHPAAALRLIDFMTSDSQIRKDEREDSQYPVLKRLADDLDLRNPDLVDAIKATTVLPRPVIAEYFEVSEIISREVKELLDDSDGDDGLAQTKLAEIQRAVQGVLDNDAR